MRIDRDTVLETARGLIEKKKYDRAISEYQKLLEADPDDARTLLKIADLHARTGANADAVDTYERVGDLYAWLQHTPKAIAAYSRARELSVAPRFDDRHARITFKVAQQYAQCGLVSDAIQVLDERARRLEQDGRMRESLPVVRKIAELDPDNPAPRLRLAEALMRLGETGASLDELRAAAPNLARLGNHDEALRVLERLLEQQADPALAKRAAELHLARNGPNDPILALRKLQICVRSDPKDVATLTLLARAFEAMGQLERVHDVECEIAAITRGEREAPQAETPFMGVPAVSAPLNRTVSAPLSAKDSEPTSEPSLPPGLPVQVIQVTPQSWNAMASRLQKHGEGDQVIAFVCSDDERSTMRTLYGVVKVLIA